MTPSTILIVDDEEIFLLSLQNNLARLGYAVVSAANGRQALTLLKEQTVDLVITDLNMPEMDGMQLMLLIKEHQPSLPVVVFTAKGSIESAVDAIRLGAFDYLEKSFAPQDLDLVLRRALEFGRLSDENQRIRGHYSERYSFQNIVTQSPTMRQVLELASRMAESTRTTISLTGESGVGKEVLARAIHSASGGMADNFVAVNCAAIPESLLESELFGHVRGSFTGAERDREGKFSLAKGGTVLLDEIGDMPLALQAKLLRVLEERSFEKIGSNAPLKADFRVIVATHHNLAGQIQAGTFREDLFYRINVVPITIPPLRERKEDIPLLVDCFLKLFRKHQGKKLPGVSLKSLELLHTYSWPGNIRELRNVLEYAAILVSDELIRPEHLRLRSQQQPLSVRPEGAAIDFHVCLPVAGVSLEALLADFTVKVLEITLNSCNGNKSKAANILKVNRKIFYR